MFYIKDFDSFINEAQYESLNDTIVKTKAAECKTRSEFAKKYSTAYHYALDHKMLPELFGKKYRELEVVKAATNCVSVGEFRKEYPREYEYAHKKGILKDLFLDFKDHENFDDYNDYDSNDK